MADLSSLSADRLTEIREWYGTRENTVGLEGMIGGLLAVLDAAEQRAKLLEQRIERQRIELAGANDRNRRGNEFARRQAEQERDEALKIADGLYAAFHSTQKERDAAQARLAETQAVLEQIAAMDEPDMYAGTAERFRSLARAALTTHPEGKP